MFRIKSNLKSKSLAPNPNLDTISMSECKDKPKFLALNRRLQVRCIPISADMSIITIAIALLPTPLSRHAPILILRID